MVTLNMFILEVFASWIYLCVYFSIIAFVVGVVYFAVAFLIKSLINLEGKVRNYKIWRMALKEYFDKRKIAYCKKDFEEEDTDVNS